VHFACKVTDYQEASRPLSALERNEGPSSAPQIQHFRLNIILSLSQSCRVGSRRGAGVQAKIVAEAKCKLA
jgi:hypothetical protein